MAAAGGGEEDARQVLRMDTDCPGNGQCAELLHRGEELWETPDPKSQKTPAGREMLGCLRQCGSVGPCLDFVIRISLGSFFFYIKYGHTLGNAQNVGACHSIFRGRLRASVCTGRVRPHTKGNIKAYSWCRDADAVGSQAVASGSPSFQRH